MRYVCVIGVIVFAVIFHFQDVSKLRQEIIDLKAAHAMELHKKDEVIHRSQALVEEIFDQPVREDLTSFSIEVTLTAYTARPEECDNTPERTADMTPSRIGLLAVSRDLLEEIGLRYGQRVLLVGYGLFEIRDTMNARYSRRVDILHATPEAAKLFGKRQGKLVWLAQT